MVAISRAMIPLVGSLSAKRTSIRRAWIFTAPFEVFPIEVVDPQPWQMVTGDAITSEQVELLRELFPSAADDQNQPTP